MTDSEEKLLTKAFSIMNVLERAGLNPRLSGSLMLSVIGVKKPRDASDIDIVVDKSVMESLSDYQAVSAYATFFLHILKDLHNESNDCVYGPEVIVKVKNEYGLSFIVNDTKVDLIPSLETENEIVNGVKCASLFQLLLAKYRFSKDDESPESKAKHRNDIEYIMSNNKFGFDVCDLYKAYKKWKHICDEVDLNFDYINFDEIKAL